MPEKRLPEKSHSLVSAVLKTLAYADIFQFPLEADEVFFYLISPVPFSSVEVSRVLSSLVQKEVVAYKEALYFLKGRENLVLVRRRRESASRGKWQKALYWARFFRFCPWIKLVGVSGALAMGNSEADDDLDLVFITSRKRIWLTRAVVVLFLFLTGQYRRPRRISGRFCPNLFLTEEALSSFEKDLFIAHEVVQLRPLWDRQGFYRHFRLENDWVKDYLPHTPIIAEISSRKPPDDSFLSSPFDFLEGLARSLQLKFMAKKITREIVTDQILRFHPRDTRNLVLGEYEKRAGEALEQYSRVME